jgi:hypothetical protein
MISIDSPEGIKGILDWARLNNVVLVERFEEIALKHNVDTTGVIFSRKLKV